MTRKITCIECPKGCILTIETANGKVVRIAGNECAKGEGYAVREIEDPTRILTSTVSSEGLFLKMVPVRTDGPVPKSEIGKAMLAVKEIRIKKPVRAGDVVARDFLGLGVNLVSTRDCS